jgi:hypothetical protein
MDQLKSERALFYLFLPDMKSISLLHVKCFFEAYFQGSLIHSFLRC